MASPAIRQARPSPASARGIPSCPTISVTRIHFQYTGQCIEGASLNWVIWPGSIGCLSGTTISVSRGARVTPDDDAFIYYCDCTPNCVAAPSSIAMTLTSPAVGANPAINESFNITKTSSTPCTYSVTWTTATGASPGSNFTMSFDVDAYGQYALSIVDNAGNVIATFHANCFNGATLPSVAWVRDSVSGVYAPYTALALVSALPSASP